MEIFQNLGITCKIVLFLGNFGHIFRSSTASRKIMFHLSLEFPEIQTGIFGRMQITLEEHFNLTQETFQHLYLNKYNPTLKENLNLPLQLVSSIIHTKCHHIPAFIYLSAALSQSGFHFNQLVFTLITMKSKIK